MFIPEKSPLSGSQLKIPLSFLIIFLFTFLGASLEARFAIYGDTRSSPEIHQQVVQQIVLHKPEATFHTGDLNSSGKTQKEYDNFLQIISPLCQISRFFPARGNHEKDLSLFLQNFPFLNGSSYYTVYQDSIRFIILDSVLDLSPGSEQFNWLQKQLKEDIPTLLILHHPVFSSGEHSDELGLQLFLPELLQKSSVKAVFSAHDHNYERSEFKGITYIVTGGGGAPLREKEHANPYSLVFIKTHHYLIGEREGKSIIFKVYNLDNKILDSFTIKEM
ncbi:MAG TPA: metallophosphoesterase [Candidatus Cloacimonas acidaminovorans]|nr:metallophosphoesterase [Candidatus Cloacimonas acidaminovorans]